MEMKSMSGMVLKPGKKRIRRLEIPRHPRSRGEYCQLRMLQGRL